MRWARCPGCGLGRLLVDHGPRAGTRGNGEKPPLQSTELRIRQHGTCAGSGAAVPLSEVRET